MLTTLFYTTVAAGLLDRAVGAGSFAIAVGEGGAAWDGAPPTADRSTSRLVAEVARKLVTAEDAVFLGEDGEPTEGPTAHLRFSVTFEAGEGTGTLRECGLFGEATEEPGTGRLLSYHTHARIEKGDEMALRRAVHIGLTPRPFVRGTQATRWLGNTRSGELHDLDALTPNCQVEEIRFDRRFYFASTEEAFDLGYDPCAYCLGVESDTPPVEPPDGPPDEPAEALFDLGRLPDELAIRWPAPPRPEREMEVSEEEDEVRIDRDRVLLRVMADVERLTVAGSDIDVEVAEGVRIGDVFVERGRERIRFRGGRFGRIELAVPAQLVPPPAEYREEWLVRDVLFDGVEVDSEAEDAALLLRGRRIAVLRSRVRAERYAVWVGDTGELQSEDVVVAGNRLEAAGAQATVRLVSVLRSALVGNRMSNPERHNYRVHGRSDLAFAARNVLVDAGVMIASDSEEDEVGAVWFLENTLHHRTPSLLVVDRPLGSRLARFVATGNSIFSDVWDCFLCDDPPNGWTVRNNRMQPYRPPRGGGRGPNRDDRV